MKIGVIGSGTMGSGIASVFIENGYEVVMRANTEKSIQNGLESIEKNLSKKVQKGKLTQEQKENILKKLNASTDINDLKDVDIVIEAAVENMELKKVIFKELDEVVKKDAILATNTSSLSITEIALATTRPDKVIGMHFFNPATVMKLVEIINGISTSNETFDTIYKVCESIGKTPVKVEEAPGFIVNRILIPMINEAVGILGDGVASK
jgi:3-hydroxybutyryl-CoA dehydrogenase